MDQFNKKVQEQKLQYPDKQQQRWADCEIGVIIHYSKGLLGMGELEGIPCEVAADPAKINPEKLDTDQWLECAKSLGAKYAVFVANQRNCQGISLWQSESNPRSLKQSPYQNGTCDLVEEFISSCKKYDILPGIYYQTGFGGHYFEREKYRMPGTLEHEEYLKVTEGDLRELWENYGKWFEIWFDGGASTLKTEGVDVEGLLERLQPEAICFQGPENHKRNLRWIGNEDGIAPLNTWSTSNIKVCGYDGTERDMEIGKGCPDGKYWFPAESDMGNRKPQAAGAGWGWSEGEEYLTWTPDEILERYYMTVGRNTNLLIGECIADDGKFHDVTQFREAGRRIRQIYKNPIGEVSGEGMIFEVICGEDKICKTISIMEDISLGERIRRFRVIAKIGEGEKEIFEGECIGHKRLIPLDGIRVSSMRLEITESIGMPQIRLFGIYG